MSWPTPGQRRGWFHENYEVEMPADPEECAAYEKQLEALAEHGPAQGQETNV